MASPEDNNPLPPLPKDPKGPIGSHYLSLAELPSVAANQMSVERGVSQGMDRGALTKSLSRSPINRSISRLALINLANQDAYGDKEDVMQASMGAGAVSLSRYFDDAFKPKDDIEHLARKSVMGFSESSPLNQKRTLNALEFQKTKGKVPGLAALGYLLLGAVLSHDNPSSKQAPTESPSRPPLGPPPEQTSMNPSGLG